MIRRPLLGWALCVVSCFTVGQLPLTAADKPLILAHRGGAFEFEENTMEGFRGCYERGIRGYETDIRLTKDGVLVILHDDTLDRTHNATGAVEHKTVAELKEVTTKKGQKLLFLAEFLTYFADKPGVYIELEMKTSNKELYPDARIAEYCQKLYQAAEAAKARGSTYVYSSFDERPLKVIDALDKDAPLSLIVGKPCSAELIEQAKAIGADRIACQLKGTSRAAVELAHKNHLMVNGWPGRAAEDYYLAIGLGLDVHCTDIPTVIQTVKEKLP